MLLSPCEAQGGEKNLCLKTSQAMNLCNSAAAFSQHITQWM